MEARVPDDKEGSSYLNNRGALSCLPHEKTRRATVGLQRAHFFDKNGIFSCSVGAAAIAFKRAASNVAGITDAPNAGEVVVSKRATCQTCFS